ncbi:MAG TPA: hypothetical protein VFI42_00815 [Thermomicrobiaceae bacterium]|nr:hypothetical protein [Thermomicrobiaceae bacterium]
MALFDELPRDSRARPRRSRAERERTEIARCLHGRPLTVALLLVVALLAGCSGPAAPATGEAGSLNVRSGSPGAGTPSPAPSTATATQNSLATSSPAAPATPEAGSAFAYGFNVFVRGDGDGAQFNDKTFAMVTGAGFDWIHFQLSWKQFEPNKGQWDPLPTDRIVKQALDAKIHILVSVVDFPDWARDLSNKQLLKDWSDYQEFVHFIADRYRGQITVWEIGNEENLAYTVGGTVRVTDYAHLLEAGYKGVKTAAPDATVLFGALTPTGINNPKIAIDDVEYLKQFYALQDGYYTQFFDALGMHANATKNAPDLMWPDNPGTDGWSDDGSFYFRRVEQLHQVMLEHNDARPAWITEFGWTTANQAPGYEYGKFVSPEDQATYLVRAFQIARQSWPWCVGMVVWNLNYSVVSPPTDEKTPWAVLNADWSPRPAYTALTNMPKP